MLCLLKSSRKTNLYVFVCPFFRVSFRLDNQLPNNCVPWCMFFTPLDGSKFTSRKGCECVCVIKKRVTPEKHSVDVLGLQNSVLKKLSSCQCIHPCLCSDSFPSDPVQQQYNFWLSLVDKLGVKAFVDLTLSPSVRQGTQHLLRITGLGEYHNNNMTDDYDDNFTGLLLGTYLDNSNWN